MGVYNEQGAALEEPESCHLTMTKSKGGAPPHRSDAPTLLALRGQLGKLPPKDDTMFMVGGWTPDDPSCLVEQFCPEYNEWRAAARMVNSRGKVAVGTLEGQIYTVGGEDAVRCYSSVERYTPDTDSWSADVAPLSSPRSGVCLAAMDGYLYAVGGHDGIAAINTVERYDPHVNTWSKQAAMLSRRSGAVAAVLGGHLYVVGGNDGEGALNSVERYSPVDGTWSLCAHMLSPRENGGCAVYLGHIYVAGGRDELGLKLCGAERLDPGAMRWTPVKRMRSKRDDMSLVVFNGALMAVGGSDGVTSLKTLEVYCHETNSWRHFGSMRSKHPGGRVAVLR
ncbi:Kelch-like protein 20 [Liparis tanakae]|uniref:Kelch-like protein 20 n=1 Tax=Liparis tanakae TaxID=230148 RepID=A0A4Z2GC65_9TELE|nr:Kelch-like protein 20 [Liparis tanakae]